MNAKNSLFNVGEIVEIIMGRDKGNHAVIVKVVNDRTVLIADGNKRKYDNPKKKNVRHIRSTEYISKEVLDYLKENNRISNAKLRYILHNFISNHLNKDIEERGEDHG